VRLESAGGVVLVVSPPTAADGGDGTDGHGRADDDAGPVEFDPPTGGSAGGQDGDNDSDGVGGGVGGRGGPPETTSESVRRTLDRHLPEAGVDSRWWYGVAAVPLYFLVTLVGGVVGAMLFLFAGLLDVAGFGGLASFSAFVLVAGIAALFGLVGVGVAVVFPVALYVDARAIERLDGEWTPDPVLWGAVAVVGVVVTNFVVSVPLALYYLYRRHETVGTP
jgi:hypothetical protein